MALNNAEKNSNGINSIFTDDNKRKNRGYTKGDFLIISLTILITLFGFLFRAWRLFREGMPTAYDGWFYLRHMREVFYEGWFNLGDIARDPPGFTFILIMAEYLLGTNGEPFIWAIFVFPQIICSVQLVIFFVLARRLTGSKTVALLSMFFMSFFGFVVYRNQNVAPEVAVLGIVPFVVFYLYRYLERKDIRMIVLAILMTVVITLVHHLTTVMVLAIWHVVLPYDVLYRRFKTKTANWKNILINLGILVAIDLFVILYWVFGLNGFPLSFIQSAFSVLFAGISLRMTFIMIFGGLLLLAVGFSVLFYNFDRKKINIAIIIFSSVGAIAIFIFAMFFGAASPDQTIWAGILAGTPILVTPPLAAIGLISLPNANKTRSRVIRGWALSQLAIILVTAAIPIMSSILGRLTLYYIPILTLLPAIAIFNILKKVKLRKWKAVTLIALIGAMALTTTYSYPKPENNWGQQEVYWQAEFAAIDFIIFVENLSYPSWVEGQNIVVDSDFRLAAIVEGYGNLGATFEIGNASWLTTILLANETNRTNLVA
ncbi:MAG: glycosyltransferase family 39 protein, partial [Candidatus Heimdallarchaeota archaeon]|nr:glycosyltransferase family 39 protein [Candidatus Heimdallarchaeota archaeon]